jgi:hypothetical protein
MNDVRRSDSPPDQELLLGRARGLLSPSQFALPIGDSLMALLLLGVLVMTFVDGSPRIGELAADLTFGLYGEAAFVMLQWTLSDITTRLKKRPPIWGIVLTAALLLLIYPETRVMILMASQRGAAVLIPLLLSIGSRFSAMWSMPSRPVVEKLAARAQSEARLYTAIALFGAMTLLLIAGFAYAPLGALNLAGSNLSILVAGFIYFAVAAYDDWRVRTKAFANHPTRLFSRKRLSTEELDAALL